MSSALSVTAAISDAACVSIELGGRPYRFSLDLGDLARAETHYRASSQCNLIKSIIATKERVSAAIEVFACSLHAHHPETSPAALIALGGLEEVAGILDRAWAATSIETEEANRNLVFDLDALADASEQFSSLGEWMPLSSLIEGLHLASVMAAFPCALRRFRPDLTFAQAQKLMTLRSVYATVEGMTLAFLAAAPESQERFALRVYGLKDWTGMAQA